MLGAEIDNDLVGADRCLTDCMVKPANVLVDNCLACFLPFPRIEAFWMLPDLTVITQMTVEFIFLFSLENRIPVLTFSEKYVESGALLSVGIDAFDIGVQAAEMALRILAGSYVKNVQRADARTAVVSSISPKIARKVVVSINSHTARNLGITIDEKIIEKARIVN